MAMARNRKVVRMGPPWLIVILALVVIVLAITLFRR